MPRHADRPRRYGGAVHELVIEARQLTKRFGKTLALDRLDLEVPRGACLGVLGESGSGKSVLLRILAGLTGSTSGEVTLGGTRLASRQGFAARRRLGVLDQEPSFYDWMTGRELLAFAADLLGIGRSEAGPRIQSVVDRVGLSEAADRRLDDYPLPLRQRLGVAQALVGEPDVLLLDEPLGWLDPPGRYEMLALLGELRATTTIVIATAELDLVEAACESVVVLDEGRVVARGATADVIGRQAPRAYVIELEPGPGLALEGLLARLAHEPWVREAVAVDGVLRVAIADEQRARRELLPAVVATGLAVVAVRRERQGIETLLAQLRGSVE
jgi:ABC-2 type transport system ATP-binding protein